MPYTTNWIDPALLLTHAGINVYRAYKDDDYDNGPLNNWVALYDENSPHDHDSVETDVRDLYAQLGKDVIPRNLNVEDADVQDVIRAAIDAGLLSADPLQDGRAESDRCRVCGKIVAGCAGECGCDA